MSVVSSTAAKATRRNLVRGGVSLVVGAAAGYGMASLARALGETKASLTVADIAAQMMATAFIAGGGYLVLLASDRKRLARVIECDTDTPASNDEVGLFRWQAALLALAGVIIALPTLFTAYAHAHPGFGAGLLATLLVLLAVQSWMNWRVFTRMDEFVARAFVKAATLAFCIGQGLLLAWAAAERFVAAPRLTTWDAFVLLTGLYVAASAVNAVRSARR